MDEIQLDGLHNALKAVRDSIDEIEGRYDNNIRAELMQMDTEALTQAMAVVHRLMLWRRFPHAGDTSYLPIEPASVGATRDR